MTIHSRSHRSKNKTVKDREPQKPYPISQCICNITNACIWELQCNISETKSTHCLMYQNIIFLSSDKINKPKSRKINKSINQ